MTVQCPQCRAENPESQSFCGECGTKLTPQDTETETQTVDPPRKELTTGSVFAGRYQIIEELGRGGMGRVYKALDTEINEKVAVKLLRPEIASDSKTIARFRDELRLARKIRQKNVCQMYDISRDKGSYFITMEYVRGEDLKHLIRKVGGLSPGQVVNVAKQTCGGLAAAHKIGVVHRDLKPQNIMLDEEGCLRIMDFGIARSLKSKGLTGAGMIIGTPEYMSPEQVEGKEVDARSDIYSLGVIIFEMLTGRVPFEAENGFAVGYKHKNEPVPDPVKINPNIHPDLARIVLQCLEKDKDRRYQSVEELRDDIKEVEQTLPATTSERFIPKKKTLTSREFTVTLGLKKLIIPAALLLIAAAALVFWFLRGDSQAVFPERIANSVAVIGFENLTGEEDYDYLRKAIPTLLITNLENSGMLHVATWERMEDIRKQIGGPELENIHKETGFEICRREGIKNIVIGSFTRAGEMFAIDVKVLDAASKDLVKSASAQGEGEDSILRSQIDDLSRDISTGIGISQARLETARMEVMDITTDSMEAYRCYLKGVEAYEKFYYGEAKQHLEKAVSLDPEFAAAYLYLGRTEGVLGHSEARNKMYIKAEKLSSQASEKERLMIQAQYTGVIQDDTDKRIEILEEVKNKYPREKYVYYFLGIIYQSRDEWGRALQNLQTVVELDPQYGAAYNQIAYIHMKKGEYDQAVPYFEKYAALNPEDANPVDSMAELYFHKGQFEEAVAKYELASQIKPGFLSEMNLAIVYAVMEKYPEALHWLDVYIKNAPSSGLKSEGYLWRSHFLSCTGRIKERMEAQAASKKLAEAAGNPWRLGTLYFMACWNQLDRGEWEASRNTLIQLEEWLGNASLNNKTLKIMMLLDHGLLDLQSGNIQAAKDRVQTMQSYFEELESEYEERGYHPDVQERNLFRISWLRGKILMAEGRLAEAASVLQKAILLKTNSIPSMQTDRLGPYFHPSRMDEVARIYAQQGKIDEAISEYERLIYRGPDTTNRRLVAPEYHLELGKLYEQKGQTDQAAAQYQKLIDIYQYADSGNELLQEARRRLSGLQ